MTTMPDRDPAVSVHYDAHGVTLHHGDCLDILATLPDNSVDAVVTDPPYGLEFMGKEWDRFATGRAAQYAKGGNFTHTDFLGTLPSYVNRPAKRCALCGKQAWSGSPCKCPAPQWTMDNSPLHSFQQWCELWAAECLRVLKPGGHLLAFGGTRTWHRLACAIEDAGFEIRDSIAWMYGSGFPKSLDVSKAIDKAAGAEREVISEGKPVKRMIPGADQNATGSWEKNNGREYVPAITAPATPDAARWAGWGTALKPAFEPIVVARKPLAGTVAQNVLAHGTGALNVDGCRVGTETVSTHSRGNSSADASRPGERTATESGRSTPQNRAEFVGVERAGRWPANVVLDESQAAALGAQSGEREPGRPQRRLTINVTDGTTTYGAGIGTPRLSDDPLPGYTDTGGTSRFMYVAKADADERPRVNGMAHATVKPIALMRWLVRLVTPPGGTVLEPFAGSGTTAEACLLEGFRCIAVEREADYLPLIVARVTRQRDPVAHVQLVGDQHPTLFDEDSTE